MKCNCLNIKALMIVVCFGVKKINIEAESKYICLLMFGIKLKKYLQN